MEKVSLKSIYWLKICKHPHHSIYTYTNWYLDVCMFMDPMLFANCITQHEFSTLITIDMFVCIVQFTSIYCIINYKYSVICTINEYVLYNVRRRKLIYEFTLLLANGIISNFFFTTLHKFTSKADKDHTFLFCYVILLNLMICRRWKQRRLIVLFTQIKTDGAEHLSCLVLFRLILFNHWFIFLFSVKWFL